MSARLKAGLAKLGWNVPDPQPVGTDLPPADSTRLTGTALSTYQECLAFQEQSKDNNKGKMHARILGYLILYSPSQTIRAEVARTILSCKGNNTKLSELAEVYMNFFIRCFRKHKARTLSFQSHPSRPSFDKVQEFLFSDIREAPKNYEEARLHALTRDGFRCCLTGKYDKSAAILALVDSDLLAQNGVEPLQVAHIVPDSTYFNLEGDKKKYAASVLAVLNRFGYNTEKLNGEKVHSLYNLLCLTPAMHDAFDCLQLYLEEIEENRYQVKSFIPYLAHPQEPISFSSTDPDLFPLPDRQLIALHATCAKVAHMSGAGAYVDELVGDVDGLGVLTHDGGSADVLAHAMFSALGSNSLPQRYVHVEV